MLFANDDARPAHVAHRRPRVMIETVLVLIAQGAERGHRTFVVDPLARHVA